MFLVVIFTMVVYFIGWQSAKPLGGIRERLWRRLRQAAMFTNHLHPALKFFSILFWNHFVYQSPTKSSRFEIMFNLIKSYKQTDVFSDFTYSSSLAFDAIKLGCGCLLPAGWISVLNCCCHFVASSNSHVSLFVGILIETFCLEGKTRTWLCWLAFCLILYQYWMF